MSSKPLYGKDILTESPAIQRELEERHRKLKEEAKPVWYSKYILNDPKRGTHYFWTFTAVTSAIFIAFIRHSLR